MKWFKRKWKTWKITKKSCEGMNFRDTLLQGVNLIMLHDLVRDRGVISNYFDPKTTEEYKRWLETEIDELIKLLEA